MEEIEMEKPLFIPLNREHYCAFVDGSKGDEQRLYGPRWNEKTAASVAPYFCRSDMERRIERLALSRASSESRLARVQTQRRKFTPTGRTTSQ